MANVKPGILARVIRTHPLLHENLEKIVHVDSLIPSTDPVYAILRPEAIAWNVTTMQTMKVLHLSPVEALFGVNLERFGDIPPGSVMQCEDACLAPLYDGKEDDEILRKIGKPTDKPELFPPVKNPEKVA